MSEISELIFKPGAGIVLIIIAIVLMIVFAYRLIQHIRLRRAIKKQFKDQAVELSESELKKEAEVIKHIRLGRAIKKQFKDQAVELSESELKKEAEVIKKYFDS